MMRGRGFTVFAFFTFRKRGKEKNNDVVDVLVDPARSKKL